MKNAKPIFLIVAVSIVAIGLIAWSRSMQPSGPLTMVEGTNVACLPNGHQQLALHIHPNLRITVDGEEEAIPANIGVTRTCMAEIHTHDSSGQLHVETATHDRFEQLTFADFFDVWGQPVARDGYSLEMRLNGEQYDSVTDIPLEDGSTIELLYTSNEQTS